MRKVPSFVFVQPCGSSCHYRCRGNLSLSVYVAEEEAWGSGLCCGSLFSGLHLEVRFVVFEVPVLDSFSSLFAVSTTNQKQLVVALYFTIGVFQESV